MKKLVLREIWLQVQHKAGPELARGAGLDQMIFSKRY